MNPPIEILLVEDNPGDVRLTQEVLREGKVLNNIHVARDGEAALDFLWQRGDFCQAPRPDLILLDLNLPRRNGLEVLQDIKADPHLSRIPVVVLSTSEAETDILRTHDLQANYYISKPVDLDQFIAVIATIESFWLSFVRRPADGGGGTA